MNFLIKIKNFNYLDYLPDKAWWRHFGITLKYSLYCCIHPLDGFWDLTREGRGSMAAANFIVFLAVLTEVLRVTLTSFLFITINMEYFNALIFVMRILLPIFLWTLSNWGLTTLMDGKGKMHEIYMTLAYTLVPWIIINAFLIVLSQFITHQEGAFYWVLTGFASVWTGMLILAGMMMVHDYSLLKTIFSSLLTVAGMGIMVFVFVVFFSLVSDAAAYFVSLYKEILFRFL